ncbi:MAG TPA: glycosyltransferase family A protein, partial [Hyphomonadaceae bacterium]|nr:glycosyltransferase family A protein [Hyphomonadaceae bacterium]
MSEDAQISRPRRVSVIVPTYNRPQMLRQALASIRALEGPDLTFEILIGDNGHAPETATVAAEFGAVHLKTSEGGSGEARNVAMKALTSEYFTFLDDDDVLLPGAVRPHLAVLDAKPELLGVIGQVVYADENLNPTTPPSPAESPGKGDALIRAMLGDWFPQVGTTVVRRSVLDLVGLFDPRHGEDVDWFLRLARTRKVEFIATPCIL